MARLVVPVTGPQASGRIGIGTRVYRGNDTWRSSGE